MPISDAQRRDLKDLRAAAQERNQQQLQYLIKRLLAQLEYYGALAVVVERVFNFVEFFESYYPDEMWPRKLLVSITSFGTAPEEGVAEMALSKDFDAPGAGNFLKAVYDVTQAMQPRHTAEARIGFMASAIVNAIMAELVEAWYGDEREDDWQRVRSSQIDPQTGTYADPEVAQIAYAFWMDSGTAALDTRNWIEVADQLEAALNRN